MKWLRAPHLLHFPSGVIEAPGLFSIPTTFGGRHVRFGFINLQGGKELRSNQNDHVCVRAKSRISNAKRALLILMVLKHCFQLGLVHLTCCGVQGEHLLLVGCIGPVLP